MPAYSHMFRGDDKPHPVESCIGLLILAGAIYCFDKWVIRSEKRQQRHYQSDKALKKRKTFSQKVGYESLRMVDVFCGVYFRRGVNMNEEPFRKATLTEKRVGGCFMFFLPAFLMFVMSNDKSFDKMVDSMMYGHVWMGWFYVGWITLVGAGIVFAVKVAPKIPLFVSVPLALVSWLVLAWGFSKHDLI